MSNTPDIDFRKIAENAEARIMAALRVARSVNPAAARMTLSEAYQFVRVYNNEMHDTDPRKEQWEKDYKAAAEIARPETRIAELEFELKAKTAELEIANGEIERLSASKWRTIDSAPTDGTKVLLWFRTCKEPSTGWYDYDYDYADRPEGWPSPDNGWRNDGDHCIPSNQADCTHWMPLRAPPTEPASFSKVQTPSPLQREAADAQR